MKVLIKTIFSEILDKKLRFITLRGIGSAEITEDPPEDLVLKSINL